LFFERLFARPVPAPGGVRGVSRHARLCAASHFFPFGGQWGRIARNYGKLRQITVNYGSFVAAKASLRGGIVDAGAA
jgi:hypothetical protein